MERELFEFWVLELDESKSESSSYSYTCVYLHKCIYFQRRKKREIYPATNPSETLVKVQMQEHQETYTYDHYGSNMLTDLYVYFNRPDDIEFTVPEEDEGDVEAADTNVFPTLKKDHNEKNLSDLKYTEFTEVNILREKN